MKSLDELREQIDNIDGQIMRLLCERFSVVQSIAEYKKAHGLEVLQKSREAEVLGRITGEYAEYIREIYAAVLKTSRDLQEITR